MLAINAWFIESDYTRNYFILAGHSLGGYLASHYAMKYPHKIEKLVLLSPVGIPVKPDDYN